jgi:hypothetical protein
MPNGDTVTIQMPDGRVLTGPKANLPLALKMGAKLYDPSKQATPSKGAGGQAKDFASSLWGQVNPVNLVKGAAQLTAHPITSYEQDAAQRAAILDKAKQSLSQKNYGAAAAQGLYGVVPFLGPQMEKAGEQIGGGEAAKGLGSSVGMGLVLSSPEILKGAGDLTKVATKGAARELFGVTDKDIQPIIEKSQSDVAKVEASHAEKVESIKQKTAAKIADVQEKKIAASKAEAAAETKKAALSTKKGPVYQRLTNMADEAQKNVQQVDTKVRVLENAKWNALKRQVGNTPVDWTPVQQAVTDAEKNILQGSPENIVLFRNVMKEGAGGAPGLADASVFRGRPGVDVKEFLSSIKDPVKRDQFIKEMQASGSMPAETGVPQEGATVTFDQARGFYTEFGQKIYGRELPGDVRRALRSVQDAIDDQTMKAVAKAGGKDAVMEYRQLKSDWRDYMQTFYDKDSPVRKLKEGKDPNDKLNPITGDEGQRAVDLLGKYRKLGADVQGLGKIRALYKTLRELPSSGGKRPGDVEAPKIPARPDIPPLDAEAARNLRLESAAKSYSHPPSRWEIMFPPLLGFRLGLKTLLQNESFRDWLAKP